MVIKNDRLLTFVVLAAVVTSVFSQIDPLGPIMRPAMYASWIAAIGLLFVMNSFRLRLSAFAIVFVCVYLTFAVYCLICSMFRDGYITGNYFRVLLVPVLVTLVGTMYGKRKAAEELQWIVRVFVACAVIYAAWVNLTYFRSYRDWLTLTNYTFMLKNSAAQIWVSAILLLVFFLPYKNTTQKVVGGIAALYLLLITGLSQCRSAILALAAAIFIMVLVRAKHKFRWFAFFAVLFVIAWFTPITRSFIDQALFLTKYQGADLNQFSSGRLENYQIAFEQFAQSPFIGIGTYYVDCSYISVLTEVGILGFLIIELIWGYRIVLNLRYRGSERINLLLIALTVFYLVESLLEGYPPFGPGVSSFMFWFLCSIITENPGDNTWLA